jgi:RNA polymerase II subunit A small phosphatase-like protein
MTNEGILSVFGGPPDLSPSARFGCHPLPPLSVVVDLDETLVHSSFTPPLNYDFQVTFPFADCNYTVYVQERPGARAFLEVIAREFEPFIFTASVAEYAIPVIQTLLPCFPAERILSRMHCTVLNGQIVKDLGIFQRDLARMIIIDNLPESFAMQPANGVTISTWIGDPTDGVLLQEVVPFLRFCGRVSDVRTILGA